MMPTLAAEAPVVVAWPPAPVPAVEPADEDESVLLTCCPTARSTEATVPVMVETRSASARSVCAVVSWVWAEVTEAWSESIWLASASAD